ncbi:hypothetical protein PT974_10669 [Cladobotryum mycophilum]|uniref:Synaptobrevin n=1 Tax=Cladobotryum mycophilum TaxID=491253 RepID=A0ABR0SAI0_9HYPO
MATTDGDRNSHDISSRELSILLSRLKQNVLHPTQEDERRLRISEYERTRVEMNLNFAQSAFNKLEQTSGNRHTGRRTDAQVDLGAQREILELLFDRLEDYKKLAVDNEEEGSSEEDLLGDIIHTPSESQDSRRSSDAKGDGAPEERIHKPELPTSLMETESTPEPPAQPSSDTPHPTTTTIEHPTETSQTLRARGSNTPSSQTAHSTARAALFANRRKPVTPQTTTATAEAILDQQRGEQEAILESIRKMAGSLKTSSQSFSASLELDKDRLGAASSSMEKSELGMEAAKGRMGSLQRMTEGEGFFGRMWLYGWVYVLMFLLVGVAMFLPKLRF